MLNILNYINNIKIGTQFKKNWIFLKKTQKLNDILICLLKHNVILGFREVNLNNSILFRIYINKNMNPKNIFIINSITVPKTIKVNELLKLNNKFTKSVYILSTDVGYLTIQECISKNKGGVLLCKIK